MTEILRVDQVTKTYGKRGEKQYQALKGVNFAVNSGEFVAIMGASGSGKTTLDRKSVGSGKGEELGRGRSTSK